MSDVNLLPEPKFLPELHPTFRPAILVNRAFEAAARDTGVAVDLGIGLEQAGVRVSSPHRCSANHELEPNTSVTRTHGEISPVATWRLEDSPERRGCLYRSAAGILLDQRVRQI